MNLETERESRQQREIERKKRKKKERYKTKKEVEKGERMQDIAEPGTSLYSDKKQHIGS